jgi:hypothetical protein
VQVCQRCYLIFEDQQGLENHYKAPTPCSARLERDYGDGFDDNQWKQLKARTSKREFKGNELEYWKGVYRILFPGVEMSAIPSPCKIPCQVRNDEISNMTLVYEEENITKKSYDESCARARTQDPLLRSQILQLIHDPMQADPVGSLFDLINRHQEISVSSVATGHDGASLGISGTSQLENSGGFLNHQPPPLGGPSFNLDWPPCPQMPVPWLLPQSSFQADSGFYSTSSAGTEGDGLSLPPQPAEFGYLPADLLNVQNPVEGQNIPISTPDPMAAMADLPEHIDLDKLLSTWDANTARVSGVSRGRSSSADRADEEE